MSRFDKICLILVSVVILEWWVQISIIVFSSETHDAFFMDFSTFWTAARLALAGEAMTVWDFSAFHTAQNALGAESSLLPWLYPPTFHLALTPLGALPFPLALGVFYALSLALFVMALRRLVPMGWGIFVASPCVVFTIWLGNNPLIFASCLILALSALDRPARAGVLIALLSLKPGLGPLIPVALASARRWAVFVWSAGFVLGMALLASLIFGLAYWQAFFSAMGWAVDRIAPDQVETERMISWFAFARYLGLPREVALGAQFLGIGAMALGLWLIWRSDAQDAATPWAKASLMTAVAATSPHAFHYELLYPLAGFAFALRGGLDLPGKGLFALLWLLPTLHPLTGIPVVLAAPPLVSICFAYFIWRGLTVRTGQMRHA